MCTQDKQHGVISKRPGYTLENYCHPQQDAPERQQGKKRATEDLVIPGCPLFPTKPENTPPILAEAVEIAEYYRRLSGANPNLMPRGDQMSAFEMTCFLVACDAEHAVSAENQANPAGPKAGGGPQGQQRPGQPEEPPQRPRKIGQSREVPDFAKSWFQPKPEE